MTERCNSREGRCNFNSGDESSLKREGCHWVLLLWPEKEEMEGNRTSRLQRADVWIKEMHMEQGYEYGVGAGE